MDVLEAMRLRRMHRYFDGSPLDDETLRTFAWAATRAPAAGNQPSRFLLVVKDPRLVKTVIEVTPSYIGTPPAAIFLVLTDEARAEEQMGRQGLEHLSRVDAGAAAENIALAAVALRLGCYLFRSSNESALRAVLDLPPTVRVDWLAAVGRPAAVPSIAPKAPRQVVYVDRWGGDELEVRRP
jgi:nitroreductase